MSKFDLKPIPAVKGKQAFYQLTIDDKPDFSNLKDGETENDRKTGVLDIYTLELETKYRKDLEMIYAYMNMVSNNERIPGKKYHELDRDKNDPYPDFEFKHGDLRVYGIKISGGKIIVLGGYKNKQDADLSRLRSLKRKYFDSLKSKNK